MVFAIGSLMNTAEPAYNTEAEKYHQLARAALFSSSLFEELTVNAIQALVRSVWFLPLTYADRRLQFLMSFYLFLADRHGTSSGTRWGIMGLAVKMAQSVRHHTFTWRIVLKHFCL
jgi:hypothetical protein